MKQRSILRKIREGVFIQDKNISNDNKSVPHT